MKHEVAKQQELMKIKLRKRIELSKLVKELKERNERIQHLSMTKCQLEHKVQTAYKEVATVDERIEHEHLK